MTDNGQGRQKKRWQLGWVLMVVAFLVAGLVVPPMVSISRYKKRITELIAASLGRPVRLASVELRLVPWPGFVLTDLSVAEDPAYGSEPALHANTVHAYIRLLSLWQGKLEIGRISVDEASLNVVRAGPGRWNLDPLFRTAAAKAGTAGGERRRETLPYLEATNSRINFKQGAEKLPFSLVNTDLSFWQESPGEWRIRLRGQPARTDVSLDLEDTGIVRLEGSVRRAARLLDAPIHLDLDWQEAQLGQLSRLLTGSDAGWRGDLTGELHLDGTAEAAKVTTRLRATGVHRAEFAPAEPMDFDANCTFVYRYSRRALQNLACDSPLGDGRVRLTGDLSEASGAKRLVVALDRIPVGAGMDLLRTLRSGLAPGLDAGGTVSGKIAYIAGTAGSQEAGKRVGAQARRKNVPAQGPLTGSLTVEGFELTGGSLNQPVRVTKFVLEPEAVVAGTGHFEALAGTASVPAGAATPLTVNMRLGLGGYAATLHGQASMTRARELAQVAGVGKNSALDGLSGELTAINLNAAGPWLPVQGATLGSDAIAEDRNGLASTTATPVSEQPPAAGPEAAPTDGATDTLAGTVTLRGASWKAEYLAKRVEIPEATLHLGDGAIRWDPVVFSYGAVKGTASLTAPEACPPDSAPEACIPRFHVQFANVDAAQLQAAVLGVQAQGTLFSDFIARLHLSSAPSWPRLEGTIAAGSLALGPVTLRAPSVAVSILPDGAELNDIEAGLLGGKVHGSGKLDRAGTDQGEPVYTLECRFDKLSAQAVGQLLGLHWSGGALNAAGKVDLSGFTAKELAMTAKGTLHFDWEHGTVVAPAVDPGGPADTDDSPAPSQPDSQAPSQSDAQAPPQSDAQAPPQSDAQTPPQSDAQAPSHSDAQAQSRSDAGAPLRFNAGAPLRFNAGAPLRFDRWTADAEIAGGTVTLENSRMVAGTRAEPVEASVTLADPPKVRFRIARRDGAGRKK